ncbi:MAG: O-antigen ligase family protein [bacterium]
MRHYKRLMYPYGLLLFLLTAAAWMFGADTPLTTYLFSGLLLLLAGLALMGSQTSLPGWAWGLYALLGGLMLSDMVQQRFAIAAVSDAALAAALAVLLLARAGAIKPGRIKYIWHMMLVAFLLYGVWSFIDFIISPETIHGTMRPYHQDRLSGAFLSANTAASFFGVAVIASFASILRALTKVDTVNPVLLLEGLFRHGLLGFITFLISVTCLVLTASRAGILFTLLSVLIFLIWEIIANRQQQLERARSIWVPLFSAIGIVLSAAVFFFVLSGDLVGARMAELDGDANIRMTMFSTYWQAGLEKPWFGHGLGSFPDVNNAAMTAENAHILMQQGAAHNVVLQWFVQTGFVGVGILFLCIGSIMIALWRGVLSKMHYATFLRAVIIVFLFVGMHSMVDYAVEIPGFMWWFSFLLGTGLGLAAGGGQAAAPRRKVRRRP